MDVQIQNHRVWQRPLVPNKEHFQVLHHDESFGAEYDFLTNQACMTGFKVRESGQWNFVYMTFSRYLMHEF